MDWLYSAGLSDWEGGGILLVQIITFSLPPLREEGGVSTLWCAPIPHYMALATWSHSVPLTGIFASFYSRFSQDHWHLFDPDCANPTRIRTLDPHKWRHNTYPFI